MGIVSGAVQGVHHPAVGRGAGHRLGLLGEDAEVRKRAGQYLQHRLLGGDIDVGNDVGPALEGDLLVGVPAVLDDPAGGPGGLDYHVHSRAAGGGYGQRIFWSFCHIVLSVYFGQCRYPIIRGELPGCAEASVEGVIMLSADFPLIYE